MHEAGNVPDEDLIGDSLHPARQDRGEGHEPYRSPGYGPGSRADGALGFRGVSCLIWRGEMADLELKYAHLSNRDSPHEFDSVSGAEMRHQ